MGGFPRTRVTPVARPKPCKVKPVVDVFVAEDNIDIDVDVDRHRYGIWYIYIYI